MENQEQNNIEEITAENEGGVNSNTFWRLRKRISNHNKGREYTMLDENGKAITDPQEAKEYIATYFEDF